MIQRVPVRKIRHVQIDVQRRRRPGPGTFAAEILPGEDSSDSRRGWKRPCPPSSSTQPETRPARSAAKQTRCGPAPAETARSRPAENHNCEASVPGDHAYSSCTRPVSLPKKHPEEAMEQENQRQRAGKDKPSREQVKRPLRAFDAPYSTTTPVTAMRSALARTETGTAIKASSTRDSLSVSARYP